MKKYLSLALLLSILILSACSNKKKLTKEQRSDLKATYEAIAENVPEASVKRFKDRVVITLPEAILFQINSPKINQNFIPSLGKLATIFNAYPGTNILITGYTDITGTEDYNNDLSQKRAESAKQVLRDHNVSAQRMYSWGLGSKDPIADNGTDEGRKQNRRVEFVVMYKAFNEVVE